MPTKPLTPPTRPAEAHAVTPAPPPAPTTGQPDDRPLLVASKNARGTVNVRVVGPTPA